MKKQIQMIFARFLTLCVLFFAQTFASWATDTDSGITITTSEIPATTIQFRLAPGTYTIDWGDNTVETIQNDDWLVEHTYQTSGEREIKISGQQDISATPSDYDRTRYPAIELCASGYLSDYIIAVEGRLKDIFPVSYDHMFYRAFAHCRNLKTISSELFKGITTPAPHMFSYTFDGAGIEEIPADLFQDLRYDGTAGDVEGLFRSTFRNTPITQIESGLFDGITHGAMLMFAYTFNNCDNLTDIAPDLFQTITTTDQQMFSYTFSDCDALVEIPGELFSSQTTPAPGLFQNTFSFCDNLKTIHASLFNRVRGADDEIDAKYNAEKYNTNQGWRGDRGLFYETFNGCTSLEAIPDGLFASLTGGAEHMFEQTFYHCKSLTTIPKGLFDGITEPAESMFTSTFESCYNLESFQDGVFKNLKNEKTQPYMFGWTFYDCSKLKGWMPEGATYERGWIPADMFGQLNATDYATDAMRSVFSGTDIEEDRCPDGWYRKFSDFDIYWDGHISCEQIVEEPKFIIHTTEMTSDDYFEFAIMTNGEYHIDWGDGTGDSYKIEDNSVLFVSHEYASATEPTKFEIKMWGQSTEEYDDRPVIYFSGHNYSDYVAYAPTACDYIESVEGSLGAIFPGNTPYMFQNTFNGCANLTKIPGTLFDGVTGAADYMFSSTFADCTSVTEIGSGLFAGVSGGAENMFDGTFAYCSALTSIPGDLFGENMDAAPYMFQGTFSDCTSLTEIGSGLFAGVSGGADYTFGGTFAYCSALTSIPGDLFGENMDAAPGMFYDTFYECENLTTIGDGLFDGVHGSAELLYNETFAGTGITSVPDGLFNGVDGGAPGMFAATFRECENLTDLPDNLFTNLEITDDATEMFYETFTYCTALEEIPSTLFSGVEYNGSSSTEFLFQNTFGSCESLKSIPAGLFSKITSPAPYMFDSTFIDCVSLESLPNGLFKNIVGTPAENMFKATFSGCTNLKGWKPDGTYDPGWVPADMFAGLSSTGYTSGGPMTDVFYDTVIAESCPADWYEKDIAFDVDWSNKVSCAQCPDTHPNSVAGATNVNECYTSCEVSCEPAACNIEHVKSCEYESRKIDGIKYNDGQNICQVPSDANLTCAITGFTCQDGYAKDGNQCKPITYTITYDANGGSGTMAATECTYGQSCELRPNTFTRNGYVFSGWNTATNGSGTAYDNEATIATITGAITLYAQWTPITYNITYDANGGTTVAQKPYTIETPTFDLPTTTRTGYTFGGWKDDKGNTVSTITTGTTGNITLTAQWVAEGYNIIYMPNGGSGTMAATECTYGQSCTLSQNKFTRNGYVFSGWNTSANGSGTAYDDKAKIENITGAITLYAQWKECDKGNYCPGNNKEYPCPAFSSSEPGASVCTCEKDFSIDGTAEGDKTVTVGTCKMIPEFTVETTNMAANTTFWFGITAAGKFYVDCGDGGTPVDMSSINENIGTINIESPQSDGKYRTYGCQYTDADKHIIHFAGDATEYSTHLFQGTYDEDTYYPSYHTSAFGFNTTGNRSNTYVQKIDGSLGHIFGTLDDGTQPSFAYSFFNQKDLTGPIPEKLFAGISGQPIKGMFAGTFYSCQNLSGTIPEELFSGISGNAEHLFGMTFSGCSGLSGTIPGELFSGINGGANSMFAMTFKNCSGLTGIGDGLFDKINTAAERMFLGTFGGNSKLTSIPNGLFHVSGSAKQMFRTTFYSCSRLSEIPENLFENVSGGADGMFWSTFTGCSSLSGIPENLFKNIDSHAYRMFRGTFSECSNITSVPAGLFAGIEQPAEEIFARTFQNTGLTKIPYGLFAKLTDAKPKTDMFYQTFNGCKNMAGWLPENSDLNTNQGWVPYDMFGGLDSTGYSSGPMTDVFKDTAIAESCPANWYEKYIAFDVDWSNKVSCAQCPDTHPNSVAGATNVNECYTSCEVSCTQPACDIKNVQSCEYESRKIDGIKYNDGQNICQVPSTANLTCAITGFTCQDGYAKNGNLCEPITYTITYDLDGGTNHGENPPSYTVEDLPINLYNATLDGYTFAGWKDDNDNIVSAIATGATGNITLTAQWVAEGYNIIYMPNGGSDGDMAATECTYGQSCTLSPNEFTRNGYVFSGWNTSTNGSGTAYDDKAIIENITGAITLYAQWTQCTAGNYCPGDNEEYHCPVFSTSDAGASVCKCEKDFSIDGTAEGDKTVTVGTCKMIPEFTVKTINMKANETFWFGITAAGKFYVDCGEGGTPVYADNINENIGTINLANPLNNGKVGVYGCKYTDAREHIIHFAGDATKYQRDFSNNNITGEYDDEALGIKPSYYSPSITFTPHTNYNGSPNIKEISGSLGKIFGTLDDGTQPSFAYTFRGASNMTGTIPSELFNGVHGTPIIGMFATTFMGCSQLSGTIPEDLFSGISGNAEYLFAATFYECSKLFGAIPDKLFRNINGNAPYMFTNTFKNCSSLSGKIPENLFQNVSGGADSMFWSTFTNCSSLSGEIPENLFKNINTPAYRMFRATFSGCSDITSVPAGLFAKITQPAEEMFARTFRNTGLTEIPYGLFAKLAGTKPEPNMFYQTFKDCTNMEGWLPDGVTLTPENQLGWIPVSMFDGMDDRDYSTGYAMKEIFLGADELATSCPANWYNADIAFAVDWDGHVSCEQCPSTHPKSVAGATSINECYTSCEVSCSVDDTICPDNATCTYITDAKETGKENFGGTCGAVAETCEIQEINCNNGYTLNGNECVANTYTVKFDANGATSGTPSATEITCTYDQKCVAANQGTMLKTDSEFTGWNTANDNSGNKYGAGDDITNIITSGEITLYAQWNACDPCNAGDGAICTLNVINNACIYTTICMDGYNNLNGNGTYTPSCSPIEYNITYNENGGTTVTDATYTVEDTVTPPTTTRDGYTFKYWTDKSGKEVSQITAGTTGDIELTAQWEPITYTITYDANGGADVAEKTYTIETPTFDLPTTTRDGYTFDGWTYNGTPISEITKGTIGNKTLTAQWVANTYNVTYNCNGEIGTGSDTAIYDQTFTPHTNICTRSGYEFIGWTIDDTDATNPFTWKYTSDKEMVAVWNQVSTGCAPGEYLPAHATQCEPCEQNHYCPGGTYEITDTDSGIEECTTFATSESGASACTCEKDFSIDGTAEGDKTVTVGTCEMIPEFTVETTNMAANTAFEFGLSAAGTFYVDCGEGGVLSGSGVTRHGSIGKIVIKTPLQGNAINLYTCTYTKTGKHMIYFAGDATEYSKFVEYGHMSHGTTPAISFHANSNPNLYIYKIYGSLGHIFGTIDDGDTLSKQPSFDNLFREAQNFVGPIPEELFDGIHGKPVPHMFSSAFSDCRNLTGPIPEQLFNVVSGTSEGLFSWTFGNCTSLNGSIPTDLFKTIRGEPQLDIYYSTFYNCPKLTGEIPPELFSGLNGAPAPYMFGWTFANDTGLTGQYSDLLFAGIDGAPAQRMYEGTFAYCKNITSSISKDFFGKINGNATQNMFASTFFNSGISGKIPEGLFAGITGEPQPDMFNGMFYNCDNLTGKIPGNLFQNIKGTPVNESFAYMFEECSGLTGFVPPELFAGIDNKNYQSGPMSDIFLNSGIIEQCPEDMYQFFTGFESDWDNRVSCLPCPYGLHSPAGSTSIDQCVADAIECSADFATMGHQYWDYKNGGYSKCIIEECMDGYHVELNACIPDEQSCAVTHGTGIKTWDNDTKTYGPCIAQRCTPGYTTDASLSDQPISGCSRCANMYVNGEIAVSGYVDECEIASCMYQGEKYILENNECVPICEEETDETGHRYWNGKECVHDCNAGYSQW